MADVQIANHGSIIMVTPMNSVALDWVEENVSLEPWMWMGGSFACDPRSVDNLITGMQENGLTVE